MDVSRCFTLQFPVGLTVESLMALAVSQGRALLAAARLRIRHEHGGLLRVDRGDAHAALDVFLLVAEAQENVPGRHL